MATCVINNTPSTKIHTNTASTIISGCSSSSGSSIQVIDNLTSTNVPAALSANQGRVLNDKKTELILNEW